MGRDELVVSALLVSFAALATAHAALVAGLASRRPRWRALVALVVAPLAPYWGRGEGMTLRVAVWVTAALAYGVARVLAGL